MAVPASRQTRGQIIHVSLVQMYHLLAKDPHIFRIMADQQQRHCRLCQHRQQFLAQMCTQALIQRGKGLIQQQRLRLAHQCPGQRRALALATGYLCRQQVGNLLQRESPQPLLHRCQPLSRPWVEPATLQRKADVLTHGQVWKQRIVLEHITDPPLLRNPIDSGSSIKQGPAMQLDYPGIRSQQAGYRVQGQALAGTGGPAQHHLLMGAAQCNLQHKRLPPRLVAVRAGCRLQARSRRLPGVRPTRRAASSSTAMHSNEDSRTSRLARPSLPACTAS